VLGRLGIICPSETDSAVVGRLLGLPEATERVQRQRRRRWTHVKVTVEIEELEAGITKPVAEYACTLFKVQALKRAVTEAFAERSSEDRFSRGRKSMRHSDCSMTTGFAGTPRRGKTSEPQACAESARASLYGLWWPVQFHQPSLAT
jgi:hypothetical protein